MTETVHPPLSLPLPLLQAWERTLMAVARLPRGTSRDLERQEWLETIIRSEQRAVHELWEIFTQERRELRRQLLAHKREAVAYFLGFHLPNAARLAAALDRLTSRTPLAKLLASTAGPWRWHDLGCGTGALAHAGLTHLARAGYDVSQIEFHLTDASGVLLDMARALFAEVEGTPQLKTRKVVLEDLPVDKFQHSGGITGSIYSLGYVWNELAKNRAAQNKLMKIWQGHVDRTEPALIFMIEPATQDLCRAAMQWRDDMVERGWIPLYPCPSATPCPMLKRTRDWCYSEASWRRPRAMMQLDRYLELDRSHLSATIFVLASPALHQAVRSDATTGSMVVGRPSHTENYGFDYLVCSGDSLEKLPAARGAPIVLRGQPASAVPKSAMPRAAGKTSPRHRSQPQAPATPARRGSSPASKTQTSGTRQTPSKRQQGKSNRQHSNTPTIRRDDTKPRRPKSS